MAALYLNDERRLAALECSWELEALIKAISDVTTEAVEDIQSRLLLRGLAARANQLNSALMAALGDDTVSTESIERTIEGPSYQPVTH